jgi:hypothetical protein
VFRSIGPRAEDEKGLMVRPVVWGSRLLRQFIPSA